LADVKPALRGSQSSAAMSFKNRSVDEASKTPRGIRGGAFDGPVGADGLSLWLAMHCDLRATDRVNENAETMLTATAEPESATPREWKIN
jgi:hypothetical protein